LKYTKSNRNVLVLILKQ